MSETRELVAILVADVVGYSRLAGADEERTLARLRGLRSDLIDPAIAAHYAASLATPAYETGGFKDKLETLKREGRWRLIEATASFHVLRRSVAYRDHAGRVLVYGAIG